MVEKILAFLKTNWKIIAVAVGVLILISMLPLSARIGYRRAEKHFSIAVSEQQEHNRELRAIISNYEQLGSAHEGIRTELDEFLGDFTTEVGAIVDGFTTGIEGLRESVVQYESEVRRAIGFTRTNDELISEGLRYLDEYEQTFAE